MNKHEYEKIEQMMYHAARGANNQLFDGLSKRFLFQMEEEIRAIHERLERIERLVKMLIESRVEQKVVNVEEWKPNPEIFEKVDKEKLAKAMEDAMKVNTLRTIPMPKVEIPKMKGADEE